MSFGSQCPTRHRAFSPALSGARCSTAARCTKVCPKRDWISHSSISAFPWKRASPCTSSIIEAFFPLSREYVSAQQMRLSSPPTDCSPSRNRRCVLLLLRGGRSPLTEQLPYHFFCSKGSPAFAGTAAASFFSSMGLLAFAGAWAVSFFPSEGGWSLQDPGQRPSSLPPKDCSLLQEQPPHLSFPLRERPPLRLPCPSSRSLCRATLQEETLLKVAIEPPHPKVTTFCPETP
jgi:hypothetical protein